MKVSLFGVDVGSAFIGASLCLLYVDGVVR